MSEKETAYFKGEGGVVWPMTLPLPEVMGDKVTRGQMRRVNADGTPYSDPAESPAVPPAQSAPKVDWVGYAVRVGGMDLDTAEAMTKADLVDAFGRE
jgi:hypothetical protein